MYNDKVKIYMSVHLIANKNALQNGLSLALLHISTFMSSETRYSLNVLINLHLIDQLSESNCFSN